MIYIKYSLYVKESIYVTASQYPRVRVTTKVEVLELCANYNKKGKVIYTLPFTLATTLLLYALIKTKTKMAS